MSSNIQFNSIYEEPKDVNVNYLNELDNWLIENDINKSDICLMGSSCLACLNIRENHDLEFCVSPNLNKKINNIQHKYKGLISLSDNLDLFINQLLRIGISDRRIFKEKLYFEYFGYNVIDLRLEYLYKKSMMRNKDISDLRKIELKYPDINESARKYIKNNGNRLLIIAAKIKRFLKKISTFTNL